MMEVGGSSDRLLSSLLTHVLIYRPAHGVGTARAASAALQHCTAQNYVQHAVPAWRILWHGLACHWTVTRGCSNMVNTCLRDCSEPNCPALWDLRVRHRDFTRQLSWALWRHVISLLSRSSPDRASSSANPPGGGASPTWGRNFCFASLVVMSIVRAPGWVCASSFR